MESVVEIERLHKIAASIEDLSELLIEVVEGGASIGFLPPLNPPEARTYWENVLNPEVILLVAKVNQQMVGSVQLHLSTKPNGKHRAEIAKLMTHSQYRRMGIGRILMNKAEETARKENRSLIVLDTREGDASNQLYTTLGYLEAGRIPKYALSANGKFDTTVMYYKLL